MARPRLPAGEKREKKRTVRLAPKTDAWVAKNIGPDKRYKDFTHLVERAIVALRDADGD